VRTGELVILAELLLRGPQTLGELRGRASRMHPLDSLDIARDMLRALMERAEPLARQLPPAPGSRAERYAQLLCPDLHPTEAAGAVDGSEVDGGERASSDPTAAQRIAQLERDVAELRDALRKLARSIGEPDPLAGGAT
jgi:uncharacterized protein YceH (UPF0502 family)